MATTEHGFAILRWEYSTGGCGHAYNDGSGHRRERENCGNLVMHDSRGKLWWAWYTTRTRDYTAA